MEDEDGPWSPWKCASARLPGGAGHQPSHKGDKALSIGLYFRIQLMSLVTEANAMPEKLSPDIKDLKQVGDWPKQAALQKDYSTGWTG
ncbi:hypothetical protein HRR90_008618 [Exophiala dermatitidis]|uniref:Uncharacterized protein n=1 Tax=Exophiala dermatitidis TaxID=5970 RepID=A0AAN6EW93_EXODE|nr:hypothetical protein HRR90_008618 [Exophiala dermatitidis]KAJ4672948.1 hypothetical protein HRR93_005031 [Exophiala dermatitidis]KAJ8991090.1 hypothetical protein HRR80_005145 [Exophiala dermatitidis]